MNIDDENNLIRIYGRILKILITSPNVCTFCKHYFMNVSKDKGIRLCCDAFPEGIPRGIFNSAYDHRVPFPKDKGIRFELKPNLSEEEVRHVEHTIEVCFNERNNYEVLAFDKIFRNMKRKKPEPEYNVIKYIEKDVSFNNSDYEFGKRYLGDYNYIIPRILREGDSDPPIPLHVDWDLKRIMQDEGSMKTVLEVISVCEFCRHFRGETPGKRKKMCCDAFPDGIPRYIIWFGYDHREAYPNDNGIRFEMKPDLSEEEISEMNRTLEYFSKEKNEKLLTDREEFLRTHEDGTPEYDVYEYDEDYEDDEDDEDDDELDDESGEKLIEKYNIKFPDILGDSDLDSMKPRYEKELKSE